MQLDPIGLRGLLIELDQEFRLATLQKASQLSEDDYYLQFRQVGRNLALQICLRADETRLHRFTGSKPPALVPNSFTMLVRKLLLGKRLQGLEQPGLERVCHLRFVDDLELVCDLTRDSNLVLLRQGRILGAHRFSAGLRPGRLWEPPARPDLPEADQISGRDLCQRLQTLETPLRSSLPRAVFGLTPSYAERLIREAGLSLREPCNEQDLTALETVWDEFWSSLWQGRLKPGVTPKGELTVRAREGDTAYPDLNTAAWSIWGEPSLAPGLEAHRDRVGKRLARLLAKAERRHQNLQGDLEQARAHEQVRRQADLIMAHLHALPAGTSQADLDDFQGGTVQVRLNPALPAAASAERLYRRARKLKRGQGQIEELLERSQNEIRYLQELELACQQATSREDLEPLERVLSEERGRARARSGRTRPERPSAPRRLRYQEFEILVGRSPMQNEELLSRWAARDDLWLHVREQAGAHVILKTAGREPDDAVILAAASLAARHSKSREDSRVDVVFTLVQKVKKVPGGPPGYVTYRDERTVVVDPHTVPPMEELA